MKKRSSRIAASLAVCLAVLVSGLGLAAPAYAAENSGCNGWACVKIVGSGGRVDQIQAHTNPWGGVLSFYGHFRLFGPDFAYNTSNRQNGTSLIHYRNIGRSYPNGSKFCVEAYQLNSDGSYTRRGLPRVYTPISWTAKGPSRGPSPASNVSKESAHARHHPLCRRGGDGCLGAGRRDRVVRGRAGPATRAGPGRA
ncbi:hypothetical protein [Nonomuraea sp. NPDC052265]|uniref:hypothetical protein n=1 Tax=Nonomuraea sp. NPDC052265 TaxID=3364374 RepID=UPI0037CA2C13